ncbi:MAG: hypothetical protein SF028_15685 [Candidatus Sumerlaeia bacterium]|nr:hypothetical protein [Candidatus Sumerlaeia bacterium]
MTPEEMKRRSRGQSVDMSPEAIARRLDQVSQLRTLGLALRKAQILGPVVEPKPEPPPEEPAKG